MRGLRGRATLAACCLAWACSANGVQAAPAAGLTAAATTLTAAATPADATSDPVAVIDARDLQARRAAHNAWMLLCSAMVLAMTAPGLALFYGGLVRKKNVLGVMMQCIFLMALMTLVWALWGYSLSFGGDNPWIGNGDYLLLNHVSRYFDETTGTIKTPMYDENLTMFSHVMFQGMFFVITPALICGAFAERMKFSAMVWFSVLWGTLVYCPLCHWVWDGGILGFVKDGEQGPGWAGGALDFAGGAVVHISSGVSALVCAILIGRRLGYGNEPMPPHNLTYTMLGAAMLWVGWFGFNAGSALLSDEVAGSAFAATHLAASAGAVGWAGVEWMLRGKPSALGASSGAVAGLVCITPAAGFVNPMPAIMIGLCGGLGCFAGCTVIKTKLGYDDSLDAFGVHGLGGTLGAVLTGVFATRAASTANGANPLGLIDGASRLILGQLVAIVVTWVFAAVVTFVLLRVIDNIVGLRVGREQEMQGLDVSQHGEEGYLFL